MFACTQTRFAHPNFKPLWTVHVLVSPIHPWGFPRPPWTLSLRLFPGPVSTTTLRPTWDSDAAGSVPGCTMLADLKCPAKQIWLVGIVTQQWTILNITIFMGGNYRPQMVGLWHWVLAHYALCSYPAPNIYPHLTSAVLLCASRHSNGSRLRQRNNGSHRVFLVPSMGHLGQLGPLGIRHSVLSLTPSCFPI
jgi:hypothetical protein